MKIILHSDDMNLLDFWDSSIDSKCYKIEDMDIIEKLTNSLIILNYSACNSRCLEIIKNAQKNENKLLILQRVPTLATAQELISNGAKGYGNVLMRAEFINSAIDTIKNGMVWLHPELTTQMITKLDSKDNSKDLNNILAQLTTREKEVATMIADGDSYKEIAIKLDITPRTVKAHAASIFSKLNIKDRLGLALLLK